MEKSEFGSVNGLKTSLFELSSSDLKFKVGLSDYGARLIYIIFPDRKGKQDHLVCGFSGAEDYRKDVSYHGAIVGRVANRIKDARFEIDGKKYKVTQNHGKHSLHGGNGIHNKLWLHEAGQQQIKFAIESPAGEDGYPGSLSISVTYTLIEHTLAIVFQAQTALEATLCNLAQHAYFNLGGVGRGKVYDHYLMINADYYTETDSELITTGKLLDVSGTRFDFRKARRLGAAMNEGELGFDHNFCLNSSSVTASTVTRQPQIILSDPVSGRTMSICTTQPGVQLYTANFLDGSVKGHGGWYSRHSALCLETQHFPGAERRPDFPSIILRPGQQYHQETYYSFEYN